MKKIFALLIGVVFLLSCFVGYGKSNDDFDSIHRFAKTNTECATPKNQKTINIA